MVSVQPIRIEREREQDGRILAAVPELPGVMAYGTDDEEAIRKVKAIALQVLAGMIGSGEASRSPSECFSQRERLASNEREAQVGSHRKL
jgi:predicted RNase H-like HicB family nuclease